MSTAVERIRELETHPGVMTTGHLTYTAGALKRRQIRFMIKRIQMRYSNVEIKHIEEKGFLNSEFYIQIQGLSEHLIPIIKEFDDMERELGAEEVA